MNNERSASAGRCYKAAKAILCGYCYRSLVHLHVDKVISSSTNLLLNLEKVLLSRTFKNLI